MCAKKKITKIQQKWLRGTLPGTCLSRDCNWLRLQSWTQWKMKSLSMLSMYSQDSTFVYIWRGLGGRNLFLYLEKRLLFFFSEYETEVSPQLTAFQRLGAPCGCTPSTVCSFLKGKMERFTGMYYLQQAICQTHTQHSEELSWLHSVKRLQTDRHWPPQLRSQCDCWSLHVRFSLVKM